MKSLLVCSILNLFFHFHYASVTNASLLRGGIETTNKEHRKLDWIWAPDFTVIGNNDFYDYRSEQWWNDARITGGATDPEDFLRDTDKCFNPYDGTFKRKNCPSPPDCNWSGQEGPAKLCINRVPYPDNHSEYYVLMMKCTPTYINCDKCMCGSISSDSSSNAYCRYSDQDPSDDQVDIQCSDLTTIEMTTRSGRKFHFNNYYI
mmetsp:Transcript_5085/g.7490  ORF Transcript_5085/g.7490 Transcript_5085/m.7490 type:complete len:204 (+) Transcript_5085:253-864(+)